MHILLLGPHRQNLFSFFESFGDKVINTEEPISLETPQLTGIDYIVSYGYRHLIKNDILTAFPRKVINLHISYLPWNRGADPNLWSFLENTPKGVTIHFVDEGLDTGPIIAQREIKFGEDETLRTSYDKLTSCIEDLLKQIWPDIRTGKANSYSQPEGGTLHRKKDIIPYQQLLIKGWDTPVSNLLGKALK